ncbi:DUF4817 domain-containing protein [Trichonephila clavipes]|nr:DUF4817 domain-containing protein [Trichonephila clavipes]
MKSLVYASPVDSDEALDARIAAVAGEIREMPGYLLMFDNPSAGDNLVALHFKYDQARRRFVEWAQNEIAVVPDFHKRIFFSDEAHFWLNGYVNKQNCRIWSEANPQELWFQQDGATCHTARATIDLLKDTFGDRLISRFGPVNWPPRSCDLTPLDYFLWGYVKSLIYVDKPQTLDHLEDNIRRVIADIRPQMLEKVIENWTTSKPAVAVICQKSYLKCNATRLSFE